MVVISMIKKKRHLLVLLLIPLGILITYLSSLNSHFIEKYYSNGIYKVIGPFLSQITGIVPISLGELIVVSLAATITALLIIAIIKAIKNSSDAGHILYRFVSRILILLSIIYLGFIIVWGLNYYRLPFSKIANLNVRPSSSEELGNMCSAIISIANNLRQSVKEDPMGVMELPYGKNAAMKRAFLGYQGIENIYPVFKGKYGRPKGVVISEVMSYAGIEGIYFPFTGEANVNISIPDSLLPSTTCHEMAHQRGFAREDEANYISFLACSAHPDVEFRYSGILLALINSMNALSSHDTKKYRDLMNELNPGVLRDLRAINKYWEKYEGPLEKISSNINDAYLKANSQADGVNSYGRMVDLLLAQYRSSGFSIR
jgi:hypothetical protein